MSPHPPQPRLSVVPCTLHAAADYIKKHHRHHRPPRGCLFCLAVVDEDRRVRGIAVVSRPVARGLHDGFTAEVIRVATDGCPNACSALLGTARRAAFDMGYRRIYTYTLPSEGGASLRGAGWALDGETVGGRGWATPKYAHLNRRDDHPLCSKHRWVSINSKACADPIEWPEPEPDTAQLSLLG